ncbi:MAG: hypothetical protein ABSB09_15330 [Acidimicrobiales bacterium]
MAAPPVAVPAAREWWLLVEPLHAVVYFDDGCRQAMDEVGMRGFWMGYFAGRAAPMGPVGPDMVGATFFNFHPERVRRAIPDAWSYAEPQRIWAARRAGAARALRRVVPDIEAGAARALPLLGQLVDSAVGAGRPLFAATRAVGAPDDPVEALWHACTCLREHRGDGHVAALTASDVDGIEALVLFAASEGLPEGLFLDSRGWSAAEWSAAGERLARRGLLDDSGITADGAGLRRDIEAVTDRQAARPFGSLDDRTLAELADMLRPMVASVFEAGIIDVPNPMGLPGPPPIG